MSQGVWEKVIDSKGIIVYTRPVEGSSFREFKGITLIDASMEIIAEVLRDIENYPAWVADILEARVIRRIDRDNMIIYLLQGTSWPISNRDMVINVTTQNNYEKGRATISFVAIQCAEMPEKAGIVRVPMMQGMYLLEYVSRNKTRVTYSVKSDPGGSIPATIANMASKEYPYKTLLGMQKMVSLEKYIQTARQSEDKKKIDEAVRRGLLSE